MHTRSRSRKHEHAPQTTGITIRWARLYDVVTGTLLLGAERPSRDTALELAQVKPGDVVLDAGCGTGNLTLAAKARVGPDGEVHGIDAAPEMIDVARHKAARSGADIDFQVGLVEALPFPDSHFDVVLSRLMLHHLPEDLQPKALAEMRRVLKPGGRFLALDFEPPSNPLFRHLAALIVGHGMMQNDLCDLTALMEAAGYTQVQVGRTRHRLLSFLRGENPR
jgi:demethylmenaquinone methyltransferase/2-methoxy-6-polyprenyl-1,4-benzoquinol methylase/phosphoethanolamine N-methyltransferase